MDIVRAEGTNEPDAVIRGFFDFRHRSPLAMVVAGLILPHRSPTYTPVEFVIDTGATVSVVHPTDTRHVLRFTPEDFDALPLVSTMRQTLAGITGPAEYQVVPARFIFAHHDGSPQLIETEVGIATPAPGNETLPSVLGWDMLTRFRVILDRQRGEVLLE
jgi:hypothetical protein